MASVSSASSAPKNVTAVDLPVASDELGSLPKLIKQAADLQGFKGKLGQSLVIPASEDGQPIQIAVGLGKRVDISPTTLRRSAATLGRIAKRHKRIATNLVGEAEDDDRDDAISAVVEGIKLATYRYTAYKKANDLKLERITVITSGAGSKLAVANAAAVADAVVFARDLGNQPGGSLTPQVFAEKAVEVAVERGLDIEVWDQERILEEELGGILAVSQGSVNHPRLVKLSYQPDGVDASEVSRVALVGKGVTFDSGGLSLKTSAGMMAMKIDMSGGGAVLAAMSVLPILKVPVAVDGYIPLTDNMTGGDAQRPGDVFTARNGKTVEVLNTDAEGRLILADALSLAAETEPDAIVDIATLTGSASAALGMAYSALMANDDDLARRLEDASTRTAEKTWRLPLPEEYRSQLNSTVADLKNISSGRFGGALVAGLFLREFVSDVPWAHIDMGISAMSERESGIDVKGATGYGVRLLIDTLVNWEQ